MPDSAAPASHAGPVQPAAVPPPAPAGVSAARAALSRRLGLGCHTPLAALDAVLTLRPGAADAAADWSAGLALAGPFGALELADGARWLLALSGIDPGGGPPPADGAGGDERWRCLQAALLGRLAGTPFAGAERVLAAPAAPDDAVTLRLELRGAAYVLHGAARAGAADWLRWLEGGAWTRRRLPLARFLDLPLAPAVVLASHTMPGHACRALAPGDVLLPDTPRFGCDGVGRLRLGGRHFRLRYLAPGTLHILALEDTLEPTLTDTPPPDLDADLGPADAAAAAPPAGPGADAAPGADADPGHDALTPLDLLPLTLSFELGHLRLTLGELRALAPGAVLSCHGGSPAAVAILARGRRLGTGEAVDVAGRLGIRVTEWDAA
ncbi:type III secretion system cytoplasmic ring protein SctQ [Rugamonas rubra]|uniref:Type III secretion protein Q n=1 Tax=Rugamonas rubra TaxID=758825 RepID=A0A1I4M3D6_9BURK|nr:type III secretion system cytoplasmic ring protein SctQ [Rugamonas rubra]SFL97888.1 type III secretion protein Q [Rugamonas rubra]